MYSRFHAFNYLYLLNDVFAVVLTYKPICMYTYAQYLCTFTSPHIHIGIHDMYVYMYICIYRYVCMHASMYAYAFNTHLMRSLRPA